MAKVYKVAKRILDIVFSSLGIMILAPVFLVVSLIILISSGKPVFYKSQRVGKNKRGFISYKFRTLVLNAKELQYSKGYRINPPDERLIIPCGNFLRITHLDELPQLFNVLKGDISFIGPRSLEIDFYKRYIKKNKHWSRVLKAKPGLTGLNQVCRYHPQNMHRILKKCRNLGKMEVRRRILLDLYYLKNESLYLDSLIIYWTMRLLLTRFLESVALIVF
jgi:lipopolysaccharide/colanic/teichoic acid biosynthesis glycosyltransferase